LPATGTISRKAIAFHLSKNNADKMEPFDPLAVENVGVTLALELLEQPVHSLSPEERTPGAGVYALYYSGSHSAYSRLVKMDKEKGGCKYPVYIGKAARENAKQGFSIKPTTKCQVWKRLNDHAKSIQKVEMSGFDPGFHLADFRCRFLILNDAYITLAESVLITTFRPAWNGMGLGSNGVGGPRMAGAGSLWDALHPGRGGRPAGDAARRIEAENKIQESLARLSTSPTDPRTARMIEKINRFL
jgi:hypothetical protein